MDATEISEQLKGFISTGEWGEAARLLANEWNAASEFGMYHCDVPEQPDAVIQFKLTGYPFKLRRLWDEAKNDAEIMQLILPRVASWSMRGAGGEPLPPAPDCLNDIGLLDELEETMLMWVTRAFVDFWRVKLILPRKN